MTVVNGAAAPPAATWAQTYARRIRQWRFPILAVWLALAVAGIMGGDKVRYDPDVLVYFDEDREERQAFDDIEARFGQSREVVTLIRSRDGDVFAPDILRAMAAMAVATAERPEVTALRSPLGEVDLLPQAVLDADDDTLREAGERLRQAVATGGTGEDGRIRTLVAADGSVAAVAAIVPANLGNEEAREVAAAHAALKSAVSAQHPSAEFLQTGRIMIDDAFLRESQDDVNGYAGVQLLILATLVFAALGSLSLGLIVMFLVLLTLTGSAGALGWSGIQVNGISSAAPVVLMGLVVASAIHVAMAWQEALRSGADKVSALATAMDRNAKPVALSVLTTLVSFLLLNIAEAPPFRDLGNIVALGLLGILALMFTLLPAFLTVAPRSFGRHRGGLERGLGALGTGAAVRAKKILLAGVVVLAAAVAGIASITVDDTFSHYFDESYEIRRATDLFEQKLSGTTIVDVAVNTGSAGSALTDATIDTISALADWLSARPEVARVESLAGVRETVNNNGDTPSADTIAEAAQQMAEQGVPRLVDETGQHARLSIVMRGVSSRDTLAFRDDVADEAGRLFNPEQVVVTGLPILSAQLSIGSARAMVIGMALALAGISVLLIATLRDWRLGLVSLAPNLLPVAIAFGIWGFFVGEVSFAATVVAALTYGIVVDDTVHLLTKYQRFRAELAAQLDALRAAFRTVGMAVIVTSLALAASFMPFALSGFLVNRHFGALTAITLGAAMVADLLLLPALLRLVDKKRQR